ncbi:MAG: poly [ADP-ribose] polymerase tankyrase-like [Rickettsiaceae bacterium]|jgi:hypothetical protein|nr:poly [ADP-ribose] polymerase tankyrase-like [Rickettsiaceae bacterium]
MDLRIIDQIKFKLIKYIDPCRVFLPGDKETIIEVIDLLQEFGLRNLPKDKFLSELRLVEIYKLVEKILYEINTQIPRLQEKNDLSTLWVTECKYTNPDHDKVIKSYISNWFSKVFSVFIENFKGEVVKFYLDKVLNSSPETNIFDILAFIDAKSKSMNQDWLPLELEKIYDIYKEHYRILNKRILIIDIGLPLDCPGEAINDIRSLMKIFLLKLYNFISFDKDIYNDLYANNGEMFKSQGKLGKNSTNEPVLKTQDIADKEKELMVLATKAAQNNITTNEFQKLLLLVAHPKIIIDLRHKNQDNKNLLAIASEIKHMAAKDLIDAIFSKIIAQNSLDESVTLFNIYFCFDWALKVRDLNNFKKIFAICKDIDLDAAEGKTLFNFLAQYPLEMRYEFLKVIVAELVSRKNEYHLSLELLLIECCKSGFHNLVEVLLQNGAKVNYAIKDGVIPLHIAAQNGHLELVKILLKYGAMVDARDSEGHTPLYLASAHGHPAVSDYLLNLK